MNLNQKVLMALCLALIANLAEAVSVSPIHLNVTQKARSTSLQLTNDADAQSMLDIRVMAWKGQDANGRDILEETDAVILSRPVVIVPAQSTATVRLIVKSRTGEAEDTYRVIVTDITKPVQNGKLAMAISYALPLFVLTQPDSKGVLELQNGVYTNVGNRHVRISEYTNKDGKKASILRYVFPGQSLSLPDGASDLVTSDDIY